MQSAHCSSLATQRLPGPAGEPSGPSQVSAPDDRLGFEEAVALVQRSGKCAFIAVPIFADDAETVEGARVFVLQSAAPAQYRVRFVAGPFFSAALAADEVLSADEVPERVRQLRFWPSECREEWFSEQIQVLIGRLMQASGARAPQMPNYLATPSPAAAPEVRFPIAMIGRARDPANRD